jgi:hypothetical protein
MARIPKGMSYNACYQLAFLFISFVFQFAAMLFFDHLAMWEGLEGSLAKFGIALALCVLTMCLSAKGRCVVAYSKCSRTTFKILLSLFRFIYGVCDQNKN